MGTLFLVATPIGNLEDITLRALRVLREVPLIAAEDTRYTARLLKRYDIHTPVTSYFEHNKLAKLDFVLSKLGSGDVALVSSAGTPGISDPGYELVGAAVQAGHRVVSIPGASAVVMALACSGLPTDQFTYVGFLPRQSSERRKRLKLLAGEPRTIVLFEAPHRLLASLKDIEEVFGDRQMAAARELTKVHEEIVRGALSDVSAHFREHQPRGEFTLVLAGAQTEARRSTYSDLKVRFSALMAEGLTPRRAASVLAKEEGIPVREAYRRFAIEEQGAPSNPAKARRP